MLESIQSPTRSSRSPYTGTARAYGCQLKARALLARFCRDDVLEQKMRPEVRELLGIVARAASAKPYFSPTRRGIIRRSRIQHS